MSNPAAFHHLNGYQIYPGASNEKYVILPFQGPNTVDEEKPFFKNCMNRIVFLVLSVKTEENEPNKTRLVQFPFEFSSLIFPVTSNTHNQSAPANNGFGYVGPIIFVPGKRKTVIFLAVLSVFQSDNPDASQTGIYLFVINQELLQSELKSSKKKELFRVDGTSIYLNSFIETKNHDKFSKILNCVQPTKKYIYRGGTRINKIMFMTDGRHFLVSSKNEVFMYHIENENQAQLRVRLPLYTTILNCDYRNEILMVIAEQLNDSGNNSTDNRKQEILFFNLQDRPSFIETCPSFSIHIKDRIFNKDDYPTINLITKQKESNIYENENNNINEFSYIHSAKYDDSKFFINGCKFLPGDNNFISIILFEEHLRKLFVYFFKLNHPPISEKVSSFDIYHMNSIEIIENSEIFLDLQKHVSYPYNPDKDWFDMVGNDDEFEFTFMLFSQILVRFHYFSDESSKKRASSVQVISTKGYKENMRAIMVPDQQSDPENVYKYLPGSFQPKSEQQKFFLKENSKLKFNWLKLLGPKVCSMPSIFQIEDKPFSGFHNFATFDIAPENRDK